MIPNIDLVAIYLVPINNIFLIIDDTGRAGCES